MEEKEKLPDWVAQARRDTPATEKRIHLNNAGSSLPPEQVSNAVLEWLNEEKEIGGYEIERNRIGELDEFYQVGARFLNAQAKEIAFAGSATHAWRNIFNGLHFQPGDEILTSVPEYGSNLLAFLQATKHQGVVVKVVPDDEHGQISLQKLQEMINPATRLIALSHIPSASGTVQPAAEVGKIAREAGILYLLDACQSAGQMPLDVQDLNCDFLTLTGRKYLRGPRGTGLLFARKAAQDLIDPPFLDTRSGWPLGKNDYGTRDDARRFETFEHNRALQSGLKVAMEVAMEMGLNPIWSRCQILGESLREALSTLKGVTVLDQGTVKSGIVTFRRDGLPLQTTMEKLFEKGINISIAPRISGYQYMDKIGAAEVFRASVHYFNTQKELNEFVTTLDSCRI